MSDTNHVELITEHGIYSLVAHEVSKSLIQPQIIPPSHCHQVTEPLKCEYKIRV